MMTTMGLQLVASFTARTSNPSITCSYHIVCSTTSMLECCMQKQLTTPATEIHDWTSQLICIQAQQYLNPAHTYACRTRSRCHTRHGTAGRRATSRDLTCILVWSSALRLTSGAAAVPSWADRHVHQLQQTQRLLRWFGSGPACDVGDGDGGWKPPEAMRR